MARILETSLVTGLVACLIPRACSELDEGFLAALSDALDREVSPYGRDVLRTLLENARYAKAEHLPCCQDTGSCAVFMEIGQEVSWAGGPLALAIHEGVRQGYAAGFLRKSMVAGPFERVNTGDNTPAIIHTDIVPGSAVAVTVFPKGGGSENSGAFTTLLPSAGREGVKGFILRTLEQSGGKSCPPLTVGVGIGGTMDFCCLLAKRALLRGHGCRNADPLCARFELELLDCVNRLGIGPMGTGGIVTALDVRVEEYPCHITALPVAVSLQCHAARKARGVL